MPVRVRCDTGCHTREANLIYSGFVKRSSVIVHKRSMKSECYVSYDRRFRFICICVIKLAHLLRKQYRSARTMFGYIHLVFPSLPSLVLVCLFACSSAIAQPLEISMSSDTSAFDNKSTIKGVMKTNIARFHDIAFTSENISVAEENFSNKLNFQYVWTINDRFNFKSQTTSTFDKNGEAVSAHKFDFVHRLPTNVVASSMRIGLQKKEGINTVADVVLNISKNLSFKSKRLFRLTANTRWARTLTSDGPTIDQKMELGFNRNVKFNSQQLLKLKAIVRWRQQTAYDSTRKDTLGGAVDARLTLSTNLGLKIKHLMKDDFDAEKTIIAGEYSKYIGSNELLLSAGADNLDVRFVRLYGKVVW